MWNQCGTTYPRHWRGCWPHPTLPGPRSIPVHLCAQSRPTRRGYECLSGFFPAAVATLGWIAPASASLLFFRRPDTQQQEQGREWRGRSVSRLILRHRRTSEFGPQISAKHLNVRSIKIRDGWDTRLMRDHHTCATLNLVVEIVHDALQRFGQGLSFVL